jgi:excisionase family DNA binding protein
MLNPNKIQQKQAMLQKVNKPRLLTIKEAACTIDGLSEYRVKKLCLEGELKFYKFGKKYMISEYELLDYFAL